ncbi:hypothetical protein N7517_005457 [Penicillium concentricum]|uniref:Aminoglycoside phosphotransferase domain-containing protein n=1 Tax=Penicillium concentricum TaxID=293559 RepID=A0A9W9VBL8_9EURO|nr:uncharacterized protein N7517_005457 [Penicillium concentricum]KAJ5373451.1 hypothetical protein N7517_005457 [Penicillium concentricum]
MAQSTDFSRASSNFVNTTTVPCQTRIKKVHKSLPIIPSSLFSYSSGRFLYNEAARIREQHVPFNVTALKDAVASHLGHGKVTQLSKMSEGGFNRVLIATMKDGFQAVVKIPYQSTVPKTYATASEVATLTFLSSKDIPVPKVYGWSSTTENPVGIE